MLTISLVVMVMKGPAYEVDLHLFDDSHGEHRFTMNDPAVDARESVVLGAGFVTPAEDNPALLFELMLEHVTERRLSRKR